MQALIGRLHAASVPPGPAVNAPSKSEKFIRNIAEFSLSRMLDPHSSRAKPLGFSRVIIQCEEKSSQRESGNFDAHFPNVLFFAYISRARALPRKSKCRAGNSLILRGRKTIRARPRKAAEFP